MFSDIINRAKRITGGDDGWASLPRYYVINKSRKTYFADELLQLTHAGNLKWLVSKSKDIILTTVDGWTIVITRHTQSGGRRIGGTISEYQLAVFGEDEEVLSLNDKCDNGDYNSDSLRLPIMDVYDVATTGKFRNISPAHVCGASGFGQSLDDICPACENKHK